jgi:hypothetical protein
MPKYRPIVTWGAGSVYRLSKSHGPLPAWHLEWSCGDRRASSGKIRTIGLNIRGSYADARGLLDKIVDVPFRNREQALTVIEPYTEMVPCLGGQVRVIKSSPPATPSSSNQQNRRRIELEYWRMRMIDALEAYRRYDD